MLENVDVSTADLPGVQLTRHNGNRIEIDLDAASDIDLLGAVMHELGHVRGFAWGKWLESGVDDVDHPWPFST